MRYASGPTLDKPERVCNYLRLRLGELEPSWMSRSNSEAAREFLGEITGYQLEIEVQ